MKTILYAIFSLVSCAVLAQSTIQVSGLDWQLEGPAVKEVYKNKECLNTDKGAAVAQNLNFKNGTIEYWMCIQTGRGFAGIRFHGDGGGNTEEFYIRKHQSGNPDAMQYTPVYNGIAGWQLYYGDGYSTAKAYVFDEWFKVRLVISGTRGEVYIEDMEKPVLLIHELKMGERSGKIAFYGPARFADIQITPSDSPELKGKFKEITKAGDEVIQQYQVSELFDAGSLFNEPKFPNGLVGKLTFKTYPTEADGLINLAQTGALADHKNALLLKIEIEADSDILKPLNFGFSDIAKIYVNNKAVWIGTDVYRSRDYRFLGTIGYFDTVYLDLKKGSNEVIVLLAENFGGWGFKARFDNMEGIQAIK